MKPWARIDCDILRNPKIAKLQPLEQLAFIAVILWCKEQRNGGVFDATIPFRQFTSRAPTSTRARMIEVGALVERNGALTLPNFENKQPLTEDEKRERDAERKRLKRAQASRKPQKVRGHSPEKGRTNAGRSEDALAGARETGTEDGDHALSDDSLIHPSVAPPPRARRGRVGGDLEQITPADVEPGAST